MSEHRRRRPAAPDSQGVPPEPPVPNEQGASPVPPVPEEARVRRRRPAQSAAPEQPNPPKPPAAEPRHITLDPPAAEAHEPPEPPRAAEAERPRAQEEPPISRERRKLSGHRTAGRGRTLSGRRAGKSRRAGKRVVVRSRIRGSVAPWRAAAFALSSVVFAVCAFHLASYAADYVRSVRLSNELRETYLSSAPEDGSEDGAETLDLSGLILEEAATPEPTAADPGAQDGAPAQPQPTPTPVPELDPYATMAPISYPHNAFKLVSERFAKLRRQNEDIVGWLTLPDDMLSEAVVQRDNTYYLRRDYQGYHNTNGAIFLEEHVDLSTRPYTLTLYGHNMKTGTMFACLRNYENLSFYHHNPFITFDTIYEKGRYVIFSTAEVSIDPRDEDFSGFFLLDAATATERLHIIKRLAELSKNTCEIDVGVDDQLLLLVTCVGDEEDRRVVAARRVRDGEHEDDLYRTIQTSVAKR